MMTTTSSNNPFRVLGIDVGLVRKLSDEQLKQYVKAVYKALQLIYHPDKGGSGQDAVTINAAMSDLENSEIFADAKEAYLRRISASNKMDGLHQQLANTNSDFKKIKQEFSERFWQFVNCVNGRHMCMVPNRELYLAMQPINIVRLKPYSPEIELYDVFENKFFKLPYILLGFLRFNAELVRTPIRNPHNDAFNFLYNPKSQSLFMPQDMKPRQFNEEEFLATWAPFMCADVTGGTMLLVYDARNQKPYIILGSVGEVSEQFDEPFKCYSERFLRKLHIRDTDSPAEHLRYAVEVAKMRGCRNMDDFYGFLDDITQIVKDMRYSNFGKTEEGLEKVLDKNLQHRSYRWFNGLTAREMAGEFLKAGKSYKGVLAALKCLMAK